MPERRVWVVTQVYEVAADVAATEEDAIAAARAGEATEMGWAASLEEPRDG